MVYVVIDNRTETPIAVYRSLDKAERMRARLSHNNCRIDVRAIRLRRKMSQAAFANRYGLALNALQDWEQGRRPPNRYARILLAVIDKEPEAVERALAG